METRPCDFTQQLLRGVLQSATKPIVLTRKPEQTHDAFKIEKPFQATQKQFCLPWASLRKDSFSLCLDWS